LRPASKSSTCFSSVGPADEQANDPANEPDEPTKQNKKSNRNGDDDDLPTDLRQAILQAADSLAKAAKRGENLIKAGLLIEEMSRGSKQNLDLAEPRVLCRLANLFGREAGFNNTKFLFANVGLAMQQKKWINEDLNANAQVSSMDRPQTLDGSEELLVLIKPDIFSLKNVRNLVDQVNSISKYEDRPIVLMLNENFGDQEDTGDGFLGVPQLETTQARRLKAQFMIAYYLEQVLSRQAGIIVLFKQYPKNWKLFVADEGSYKLVVDQAREPSDEEIFDQVSEYKRKKAAGKLWRSFRWRNEVEGFLGNLGIPKPFEDS